MADDDITRIAVTFDETGLSEEVQRKLFEIGTAMVELYVHGAAINDLGEARPTKMMLMLEAALTRNVVELRNDLTMLGYELDMAEPHICGMPGDEKFHIPLRPIPITKIVKH